MKSVLTLLLLVMTCHRAAAQTSIQGRVADQDNSAISFATVTLSSMPDTSAVQTTLTDTAGYFSLMIYSHGNYLIRIAARTVDTAILVDVNDTGQVLLGDIIVSQLANRLQAVTITAKAAIITQTADRIVYDLQADPKSRMSSVLDMMRKVPYLSVDADENILLRGSNSYKIYINGRPSGLMAGNPKEALRSMPAATVKSIEVITSPSARYDAEGLAGIINIVTIRQQYNGYKGVINMYEKGPVGGPGTGLSFACKKDKCDISLMAGISRHSIPEIQTDMIQTSTVDDETSIHQHTTSQTNSRTAYAGLELSYEPDSLNLIVGELYGSSSQAAGAATQAAAFTGTALQQYYRLDNGNRNLQEAFNAGINYQHCFKARKDQALNFSFRRTIRSSSLYNDILFSQRAGYPTPDYRQHDLEHTAEHTLQADYVQPVGSLTIEGGGKGNIRANGSDFSYSGLNTQTGVYETDQARSNVFRNRQYILAAYNSYTYRVDNWQFKAGIRAEETAFTIIDSNELSLLQQHYLNILPAAFITRQVGKHGSLRLSFSQRIQRPAAAQLNPFTDRSNPNVLSSGNPYLRPITSDAYELSYMLSAKGTLNISFCGWLFNNVFSPVPFYDPVAHIMLNRYNNHGKGRVFKTNIYFSYPASSSWNVTFNSDIRHIIVTGLTDSVPVNNAGFNIYLYASGGHSIKNSWRVNADIAYTMGGISLPLGTTNGFVASSISISKDLLQSRLSFAATVSNPFTQYRYASETVMGTGFAQTTHTQSYYRRLAISINYRFGKLQEDSRKNKLRINTDNAN